jgi:choline-sulfatase
VVLISVDTLRADRLPAYGYTGVSTPAIDALRRDSILFENAFTHVPLTLPSHASILTGLLPAVHGLRDNLGYRLKENVVTLPEILKKGGYATGAAVSAVVLARQTGLSRGFDFFDDRIEATVPGVAPSEVQRPGAVSAAALARWIEGVGDRPFFAFLHIYEPHFPYDPPEPYRSRTSNPYDGEIEAADAVVGQILTFLKAKGLYDGSLVVFLSDHGEGLGDHGEGEHGILLYREVLRVPLLVKLPANARAGTTAAEPAGLFDVLPTVLDVAHLPAPPLPGRSLVAAGAPPPRTVFSETLYPRLHFGWSDLASLADAEHHFIDAPRPEMYDTRVDPAERTNLFEGDAPASFRSLKAEMQKIGRSWEPPGAANAESARKLASLGYLSAGAAPSGPLADPKERIGSFVRLKKAFELSDSGRYAAALPVLRELLAENPGWLLLYVRSAFALAALKRTEEAAAMMRSGVSHCPPGSTTLLLPAAELFQRLGRLPEAIRYAEAARDLGEPMADVVLSRLYLSKGDLVAAESSARRSLERLPFPVGPYVALARVEVARRNLPLALSLLDEAEAKRVAGELPRVPSTSELKGDVLVGLGRPGDAEVAYREEIRAFPRNLQAYGSLAIVLAVQGRRDESRRSIIDMVGNNPGPAAIAKAIEALTVAGDREEAQAWRSRASLPSAGRSAS